MKRLFKLNPLVLLTIAAVLLVASTVGSTQAALTYYSENYMAEVTVSNIGTSLVENGKVSAYRNYLENDSWDEKTNVLLTGITSEGKLVLGKDYTEELSVKNTGAIDTYVRVILTKSWQDKDGVKDTTLSPELIDLNLTGSGWVVDESATTAERTVLYYTGVLPAGDSTAALSDTLRIDPAVGTKVIETVKTDGNGKTITYV